MSFFNEQYTLKLKLKILLKYRFSTDNTIKVLFEMKEFFELYNKSDIYLSLSLCRILLLSENNKLTALMLQCLSHSIPHCNIQASASILVNVLLPVLKSFESQNKTTDFTYSKDILVSCLKLVNLSFKFDQKDALKRLFVRNNGMRYLNTFLFSDKCSLSFDNYCLQMCLLSLDLMSLLLSRNLNFEKKVSFNVLKPFSPPQAGPRSNVSSSSSNANKKPLSAQSSVDSQFSTGAISFFRGFSFSWSNEKQVYESSCNSEESEESPTNTSQFSVFRKQKVYVDECAYFEIEARKFIQASLSMNFNAMNDDAAVSRSSTFEKIKGGTWAAKLSRFTFKTDSDESASEELAKSQRPRLSTPDPESVKSQKSFFRTSSLQETKSRQERRIESFNLPRSENAEDWLKIVHRWTAISSAVCSSELVAKFFVENKGVVLILKVIGSLLKKITTTNKDDKKLPAVFDPMLQLISICLQISSHLSKKLNQVRF